MVNHEATQLSWLGVTILCAAGFAGKLLELVHVVCLGLFV